MEKNPGPMSPNNAMVSNVVLPCGHVISHDLYLMQLLTFQLLRGLVFCHERKVLHR